MPPRSLLLPILACLVLGTWHRAQTAAPDPAAETAGTTMGDEVQAGDPEPIYLVFQFQGMEDDAPVSAALPDLVDEIRREFGARPAGAERYVGFTPGLLLSLNLPTETLKSRVIQALQLADVTGMPVFFHLDDMHFWYDRTDLHQDPMAVEWSGFPREGEDHGAVIPRYWLNWGEWMVFPAPPPCFESPRFKADVAHRLQAAIAAPIVDYLRRWEQEGRGHLLAGIAVGNETEVPGDLRPLAATPPGRGPEGIDPTGDGPVKVRMRRDEMVRSGYAALHWRGHDAESIRRLARERDRTEDEVITELLHEVAHDYAAFRARILHETGIPRERIYTHFVSLQGEFLKASLKGRAPAGPEAAFLDRFAPVASAVNPYSRPGFTVQRDMVDLAGLPPQIAAARAGTDDDRGWAAVESYPTVAQPGRSQTQEEYEEYLGGMFAHGARLINLYGWNIPEGNPSYAFSVRKADGVVRAIKNWVDGRELPTTWSGRRPDQGPGQGPPPSLPAKAQQVHEKAQAWMMAGGDPAQIEPLARKVEELIQAGRFAEAEEVLDQILAIVDGAPAVPQRGETTGPQPVRLARIPEHAELLYHEGGFIYTMDRQGDRVTQITFENPRHWEHVAVSFDHRYVAGDAHGQPEGTFELWIFDLEQGNEIRLLPDYRRAGVGGLAWGPEGDLYFAACETGPANQFVYRIRPDGSGLTQLTDINSVDVSISEDGRLVTFMTVAPGGLPGTGADHHTEIWVVDPDGSNPHPVYREGGAMGVASVHDPEISPDNTRVVFSKVNPDFRNWPDQPALNTAHDLWIVNLDGSEPTRITPPGPISIIPNWEGEWIVYCELNEKDDYMGMALVRADGTGRKRIRAGFGFAKWIP